MQTMVPLYGFGGVPYSAVRKAAPRKLLDNSDFTNLVAQAGIGGNHGAVAYAADRWILDSGTVSYAAGVGLTLNGTIRQKLERIPAAAYPYIGMASGEASISYDNGTVSITSSGGVIKWAALYTGEYSSATMPEYQPKGYSAELEECRRYYKPNVFVNAVKTSSDYFTISYWHGMRIDPTITINQFEPYGNPTIHDFTDSSIVIGDKYIRYAYLPTCSSNTAGALCLTLDADL